ncbi:MAG: energy transducer TonB [Gammaproteobacteria bacterium]|nr:energy transducer TonB [Gammaproteobacteria bacterium]
MSPNRPTQKPGWRHVLALSLSVSVHAALFTVLAYHRVVVESPASDIQVSLVYDMPAPRVSAPKSRRRPAPAKPAVIPVEQKSAAVAATPVTPAPPAAEVAPTAETAPTADDPQPPATAAASLESDLAAIVREALPIHRVSHPPRFLRKVEPKYPDRERAIGKEGQVTVEVVIDTRGTVVQKNIAVSGGNSFDQAALEAADQSLFTPAYNDDKPVPVRRYIPYTFKIN